MAAAPVLTERAKLYSHPITVPGANKFNHDPIANIIPFKSGLTPTYVPQNASLPQLTTQDALERYQEERFAGERYLKRKSHNC